MSVTLPFFLTVSKAQQYYWASPLIFCGLGQTCVEQIIECAIWQTKASKRKVLKSYTWHQNSFSKSIIGGACASGPVEEKANRFIQMLSGNAQLHPPLSSISKPEAWEEPSLVYGSIFHSDHQKVCAECWRWKQSSHWGKYGECLIHERRRKGIRKLIWHFTGMQSSLNSSSRALSWTIHSKLPAHSLFKDVFALPT